MISDFPLRRTGLALVLGATAAFALSLAPAPLAPSLAVLGALTLPVLLFLLLSHAPDRKLVLVAFLSAVAVRAGVTVIIAFAAPSGFFALDDAWYGRVGWEMASGWAGEGGAPTELHGAAGYYQWNALIFTLVGHVPLAPTLANAALGGLIVLLAHSITLDLADRRAAIWAALLTAFWPSLVLWSSLNLKDAAAILSILLLLRGAQRLQTRIGGSGVALLVAGLLLLAQLRGYLVWVAAAAVGLAFVLPRLRAAPLAVGALLLVAAIGVPMLGPVQELASENHLEALDQARSQLATGGSAYRGDADVSTPAGVLGFLPVGLAYFLLAPAPWQLWNTRQMLTLPEMLAWYALLPMVVVGIVTVLRERFARGLPLVTFTLFTSLSYALVEGNLGTAYRHRAQVLVLLLVFASIGIARRTAGRATSAPPSSWPAGAAASGGAPRAVATTGGVSP